MLVDNGAKDDLRLWMRGLLQDFNVFRWAGRMLMDAAAMRRRGRLPDVIAVPAGQRQQGAPLKRIGLR